MKYELVNWRIGKPNVQIPLLLDSEMAAIVIEKEQRPMKIDKSTRLPIFTPTFKKLCGTKLL